MQNKQAIVGIIAAAIILIGAGSIFVMNQRNTQEPNSTQITQEQNPEESTLNTIANILKSGKTQKCTFSSSIDNNMNTQGTFYMSNEKMRTDLTTTTEGKTSMTYVIRNGDENYIWGSDFPDNTGIKMTISLDELTSSESSNDESKKYFDPNMEADYECNDWSEDGSLFNPPSNIKFQDFSAMMQGFMSTSAAPTQAANTNSPSTSQECSICNSLTGDAKNACIAQFNCN